ncbi:uncharacterized protein LOC34617981 [Cyclospora cayetanensis]|uniref:Uncharacterized protein LOC34617981 n=1 Tax=Cyclospora cayetanensis TaxID=88456 RepID=A0A6P6RPI4_9EIME|nr:uncharacterized protein LOC34617981 [Cyclospora cayetanensis]
MALKEASLFLGAASRGHPSPSAPRSAEGQSGCRLSTPQGHFAAVPSTPPPSQGSRACDGTVRQWKTMSAQSSAFPVHLADPCSQSAVSGTSRGESRRSCTPPCQEGPPECLQRARNALLFQALSAHAAETADASPEMTAPPNNAERPESQNGLNSPPAEGLQATGDKEGESSGELENPDLCKANSCNEFEQVLKTWQSKELHVMARKRRGFYSASSAQDPSHPAAAQADSTEANVAAILASSECVVGGTDAMKDPAEDTANASGETHVREAPMAEQAEAPTPLASSPLSEPAQAVIATSPPAETRAAGTPADASLPADAIVHARTPPTLLHTANESLSELKPAIPSDPANLESADEKETGLWLGMEGACEHGDDEASSSNTSALAGVAGLAREGEEFGKGKGEEGGRELYKKTTIAKQEHRQFASSAMLPTKWEVFALFLGALFTYVLVLLCTRGVPHAILLLFCCLFGLRIRAKGSGSTSGGSYTALWLLLLQLMLIAALCIVSLIKEVANTNQMLRQINDNTLYAADIRITQLAAFKCDCPKQTLGKAAAILLAGGRFDAPSAYLCIAGRLEVLWDEEAAAYTST